MEGAPYTIPSEFQAQEKVLHSKMTMKYKNKDNHEFANISEKADQMCRKYQLADEHGNLIATAYIKVNSPDTTFEIKDSTNTIIGALNHLVTKTALNLRDHIMLLDATSKELGKTDQIDILEHAVLLKTAEGIEIGEIKRDTGLLKDKWQCRFVGNMDRRVLAFLPPFIAMLQGEKREKLKEIEKQNKN